MLLHSSNCPLAFCFALFVGLLYLLVRSRPLFVIDIRDRKAVVRSGAVPAAFVRECDSLMAGQAVPDGTIKGYRAHGGIRLTFSTAIPTATHQSFRNVWQNSGS